MKDPQTIAESARRVGRYLLHGPIASGGMATVHFGALIGEAGFSRTVAIKRLHTASPSKQLITSLLDEARLLSRVQHPNVVPTLDVVMDAGEVFVVLEYVVGESLSRLLKACERQDRLMPIAYATTIAAGVLHGLHAAHDAKSARGKPLGVVHRDVSPQNIMVGVDGLARVLDFGIATATERLSKSVHGQVKGKLAYMAPEQLRGVSDRRTDIYAAGLVLWEMLAGRRLFHADTPGDLIELKVAHHIDPASRHRSEVSPELDAIVLKATAPKPEDRYDSAREFAHALEDAMGVARASLIGSWVQELAGRALGERAVVVASLERDAADQTGEAPNIVASSDGPSGAFTEEVVSSDDAAPPSLPTTRRAAADRDDAPPAVTATITSLDSDETTTAYAGAEPTLASAQPDRSSEQATLASAPEAHTAHSVETHAPPAPRRRLWLMLAAIAVGAAIAWVSLRTPESHPSANGNVPAELPTASSLGASASAPPAEPAPSSIPEPSVAEVASAPVPSTFPSHKPAARPPASAPAPIASKKNNCDPPFTVDARGVYRLKPECL